MSTWSDYRVALKDVLAGALGTAVPCHATVPEKALPPLVMVDHPAPPYVDFEGAPFGGRNLYLDVLVALPAGSNDVTIDAVDELLEKVVDAVEDSDEFVPTQVDVGPVAVNGQLYPGGVVRCRTGVHRG